MTHDHAVALMEDLCAGGAEVSRAVRTLFYPKSEAGREAFARWLREWADALERKEEEKP